MESNVQFFFRVERGLVALAVVVNGNFLTSHGSKMEEISSRTA
jgi:hypothetical protein